MQDSVPLPSDERTFTRREVFKTAAREGLVIAFALSPLVTALARGQSDSIEQAYGYLNNKDLKSAEEAFKQLIRSGELSERVYEGYSLALQGQDKFEEALPITLECVSKYRTSIFAYAHLLGAQIGCGLIQDSKRTMRYLDQYRSDWGPAESTLIQKRESLLSKEVDVSWSVSPSFAPAGKVVFLPIPQNVADRQTDVDYEIVSGASSKKEVTDWYGVKSVQVVGNGSDIQFRARLTVSPYSVRPLLKKYDEKVIPSVIRKNCLGKSSGTGLGADLDIDPTTSKVHDVLDKIGGKTTLDKVAGICKWAEDNLLWNIQYNSGSEKALQTRSGNCGAFSSAIVALVRAIGVPACVERVAGFTSEQGKPKLMEHAIPYFYLGGIGWTEWDRYQPAWFSPSVIRLFNVGPWDPAVPIVNMVVCFRTAKVTFKRQWI